MIAAIDTNILLDVLGDSEHYAHSLNLLQHYNREGKLYVSPVVYAELLTHFLRNQSQRDAENTLHSFLADFSVAILDFNHADFTIAAAAWLRFSHTTSLSCPKCGAANFFNCKKCKTAMKWRNHLIPDFLIGAHAQNHADVLLTRDRGYYKKFFSVLIVP